MNPYIIEKTVDSNGKVTENKRNSLGRVASSKTVEYMKNLMWHTINDSDGAGHGYYLEGYDLIGKTGTAQIAKENGQGYYGGDKNVIRSISIMFPKDNPEIIIYGAVKRSETATALTQPIKAIIQNISKYYNIYGELEKESKELKQITNYTNKTVLEAKEDLKKFSIEPVIIGNGEIITSQYPLNTNVTKGERVFLVTNSKEYTMPNVKGYSKIDLEILFKYLNLSYNLKGNGYAVSQSIPAGTKLTNDMSVEVELQSKLVEKKETEKKESSEDESEDSKEDTDI